MRDLLRVDDLHVRFAAPGRFIQAVRGVSFRIRPGSTVALVGESGSGKSVVSQSIMRILPRNGEITRGTILFDDPRRPGEPVDLSRLPADGPEMRSAPTATCSFRCISTTAIPHRQTGSKCCFGGTKSTPSRKRCTTR